MEKRFPRLLSALDGVFGVVAAFAADGGLTPAQTVRLQLVVEELFVNCVVHGGGRGAADGDGSRAEIAIDLTRRNNEVVFTVTDFAAAPFDPATVPPADVAAPLAARRPGGLGLHLVRELTQRLQAEYGNGVLTIRGALETGE